MSIEQIKRRKRRVVPQARESAFVTAIVRCKGTETHEYKRAIRAVARFGGELLHRDIEFIAHESGKNRGQVYSVYVEHYAIASFGRDLGTMQRILGSCGLREVKSGRGIVLEPTGQGEIPAHAKPRAIRNAKYKQIEREDHGIDLLCRLIFPVHLGPIHPSIVPQYTGKTDYSEIPSYGVKIYGEGLQSLRDCDGIPVHPLWPFEQKQWDKCIKLFPRFPDVFHYVNCVLSDPADNADTLEKTVLHNWVCQVNSIEAKGSNAVYALTMASLTGNSTVQSIADNLLEHELAIAH